MKTKSFVGVMAVLALFASFGALPAHAFSFAYFFPGESCVNRSPNIAPYYFSGAIGNPSTTEWLYLDCPMDRTFNYDGGIVNVIDQNGYTGYDVSCAQTGVYLELQYRHLLHGRNQSQHRRRDPEADVELRPAPGPFGSVYYYNCTIPPAYGGTGGRPLG